MCNILLLGANGLVGWELQRALAPLGSVIACDRSSADLSAHDALARLVLQHKPKVIVNAAAYTAVDQAEKDVTSAFAINASALNVLAKAAYEIDALLVHYSTDYVFDGLKEQPYLTTDPVKPCNVYGLSKFEGEQFIRNSQCKYLIFRTSWVYASRGNNFAKTMLRLAQSKDQLSVVADQIGAPTGADLIADITAHCIAQSLLNPAKQGLYHLTAQGFTSWHGYAQMVLEHAQKKGLVLKVAPQAVQAINSAQYPTAAKRPANSRLNCDLLQETFNLKLPQWSAGVHRMLDEILTTGALF